MARIGYMRVSTDKQDHALQQDALQKAGCVQIFQDTISGAKIKRQGLEAMMAAVVAGDEIVAWRLDRVGRNARDLLNVVHGLQQRGVELVTLSDGIDTRSITGRLLLAVLAAIAEFERDTIKQRVSAGMASAKARGNKLGRDSKFSYKYDDILDFLKSGMTMREISHRCGVSKGVVQHVKEGDFQWQEIKGFMTPEPVDFRGMCINAPQLIDLTTKPDEDGNTKTRTFNYARVLFFLENGSLDRNKRVIATCGTKGCINPKHLKQEK